MHVARHIRTYVDRRIPRLVDVDGAVAAGNTVAEAVVDAAGEQIRIGPLRLVGVRQNQRDGADQFDDADMRRR